MMTSPLAIFRPRLVLVPVCIELQRVPLDRIHVLDYKILFVFGVRVAMWRCD